MDTPTREQEVKQENRKLALDTALRIGRIIGEVCDAIVLVREAKIIEKYLNEEV
jgi:hypothetical protein